MTGANPGLACTGDDRAVELLKMGRKGAVLVQRPRTGASIA